MASIGSISESGQVFVHAGVVGNMYGRCMRSPERSPHAAVFKAHCLLRWLRADAASHQNLC